MNPLNVWKNLDVKVRLTIIIGFFAVLIVSMFTGYFPELIALAKSIANTLIRMLPGTV